MGNTLSSVTMGGPICVINVLFGENKVLKLSVVAQIIRSIASSARIPISSSIILAGRTSWLQILSNSWHMILQL
jgi:hypothetical protein